MDMTTVIFFFYIENLLINKKNCAINTNNPNMYIIVIIELK